MESKAVTVAAGLDLGLAALAVDVYRAAKRASEVRGDKFVFNRFGLAVQETADKILVKGVSEDVIC